MHLPPIRAGRHHIPRTISVRRLTHSYRQCHSTRSMWPSKSGCFSQHFTHEFLQHYTVTFIGDSPQAQQLQNDLQCRLPDLIERFTLPPPLSAVHSVIILFTERLFTMRLFFQEFGRHGTAHLASCPGDSTERPWQNVCQTFLFLTF